MGDTFKRARHTYKNQGMRVFVKKTANLGYRKTIAKLYGKKHDNGYDKLKEEYAFVSNRLFQISSKDIVKSQALTHEGRLKKVESANWFVPNFDHLSFGGIFTIFRFIEKFSDKDVLNRIVIYDNPAFDTNLLKRQLKDKFPRLNNYELIVFDHNEDDINNLPECDIAICSFWVSAYLLLKFNKTKKKYYFVQDYEPLFYEGGSTSALAESTYRFGFKGIVNTPGLLSAISKRHGMEGVSFIPAVDQTVYFPEYDKKPSKNDKKIRIFFYARPNNPRNAFNLGINIIRQLLSKHGDTIEIIAAGADWQEAAYGLKGKIDNKGLLKSIYDVAELYRSCDIGFVYMLSKHPSYQPFEFMACGMATVTNYNEDNLWLLKHEKNCLLSEPSPKAMAEQISLLVEDDQLRNGIIDEGYKAVQNTWDKQTDQVWNYIVNETKS